MYLHPTNQALYNLVLTLELLILGRKDQMEPLEALCRDRRTYHSCNRLTQDCRNHDCLLCNLSPHLLAEALGDLYAAVDASAEEAFLHALEARGALAHLDLIVHPHSARLSASVAPSCALLGIRCPCVLLELGSRDFAELGDWRTGAWRWRH